MRHRFAGIRRWTSLLVVSAVLVAGCAPAPAPTATAPPAKPPATVAPKPSPAAPKASPAASPKPADKAAAPADKSAAAPGAPVAKSTASQEQWQQLLEAGRKEGRVVIAGPPIPPLRQAYTEQFPKATGIQLEYLGIPTQEMGLRAEREASAGRVSFDVMIGGGTELIRMLPNGQLEPIAPILYMPGVSEPTNWKGDRGIKWWDPQQQYLAIGASYVMTDLFINTQQVQPGSLKSWKDLADPKWKGKIIWHDPRAGGPGQAVARYLLVKFGEPLVVDIFKNVTPVTDIRPVSESVARGAHAIGLGAVHFDVEEFRKAGLPIAREYPQDGIGSLVGGFSVFKLLKNSPNPKAAAVFANWALSNEGQTAYQGALLETSLRKDVPSDNLPDYIVPKPGVQYDIDQYTYDFYMNTAPKLNQRLPELLGR